MVIITETHCWVKCREWELLGVPGSLSQPSPQASGIYVQEGSGKILGARGMTSRKTPQWFSDTTCQTTYKLIVMHKTSLGLSQTKFQHGGEWRTQSPTPSQEAYLKVVAARRGKTSFLHWGGTVILTVLQCRQEVFGQHKLHFVVAVLVYLLFVCLLLFVLLCFSKIERHKVGQRGNRGRSGRSWERGKNTIKMYCIKISKNNQNKHY